MKASEVFSAYTAGFLDGEASFSCGVVTVSQVNPEPLYAIQRVFGGHLKKVHKAPPFKDIWILRFREPETYELLQAISPYLIHRYPDACQLLQILDNKLKSRGYLGKLNVVPKISPHYEVLIKDYGQEKVNQAVKWAKERANG